MRATLPLLILAAALAACQPASAPPASAPASAQASASLTREQATAALMALPELKEWAARIEQESQGKLRGAVIAFDPKPASYDGRSYYQLSFVENGADAARRLSDFLVDVNSGAIFAYDAASDRPQPLDEWRKERAKP